MVRKDQSWQAPSHAIMTHMPTEQFEVNKKGNEISDTVLALYQIVHYIKM
jgi:hypothetical protein